MDKAKTSTTKKLFLANKKLLILSLYFVAFKFFKQNVLVQKIELLWKISISIVMKQK